MEQIAFTLSPTFYKKTIIKVLILIIFDRISALLFSGESKGGGIYDFNAEEAPVTVGIVLGLILDGTYHPPLIYDIFFSQSAVITIGYILLILTIIEVLMFRKGGNEKKYMNLVILGLIAAFAAPQVIKYQLPKSNIGTVDATSPKKVCSPQGSLLDRTAETFKNG